MRVGWRVDLRQVCGLLSVLQKARDDKTLKGKVRVKSRPREWSKEIRLLGQNQNDAFVPMEPTDGIDLMTTTQDSLQQPLWAEEDLFWAPGSLGTIDGTSWEYLSQFVDMGAAEADF